MYLCAIALWATIAQSCETQPEYTMSSIYGTVTDIETGEPIPNSEIYLMMQGDDLICMPQRVPAPPTLTDSLGRYKKVVYVGRTYYIGAVAEGYSTPEGMIIDVLDEKPIEINFQLRNND